MQTMAIAFLATVAMGGVLWVFVYPIISGQRKTEQRMATVARTEPVAARASRGVQKSRRDTVESTLKEIEQRHKKEKSAPISVRIAQAGLKWSKQQFIIISGVLGLGAFLGVLFAGFSLMIAAAIGFAAAFGLPRWLLSFLKKRREAKFLHGFPDAVDVIVRGIKAGLPLFESLKVVAADSPEPLRSEFSAIIETQAIGMPLGEACGRLFERMPVPEANFFGIVIAIQQKSGGNLSEALGNLSKVLRDRKKLTGKIRSMSQEAKSSAGIIGSLPILVSIFVYITSPAYILLLFQTTVGNIVLAGSLFWMFLGIMVMRKMINFDY